MRWAVEARRKERGGEQEQNTGQERGKQGKHARFGQEEQSEETKAESTDETGKGTAGLVREGDERCRADETSRKERVTEERVSLKAKEEELEGKEHSRLRTW